VSRQKSRLAALVVASLLLVLMVADACREMGPEPPLGFVLIARRTPPDASLYLRGVCAGMVVTDGVVVTARHCFPSGADSRYTVIQHASDLCQTTPDEGLPVAAVITSDPATDLMYLSVPGVLAAEPVGLPPEAGATLEAWGWGGQSTAHRVCQVRPIALTLRPEAACAPEREQYGLADTFFCVVPAQPDGRNTCSGDSGGPVLHRLADGRRVVVGVTSSGAGCGPGTVGFVAALQATPY